MSRGWSEWEDKYLIENYEKHPHRHFAAKFDKAVSTISYRVRLLKMEGKIPDIKKKEHNVWTDEEQTFLEENLGKLTLQVIAKKLGRSYTTIQGRAVKLKRNNPDQYDYKPRRKVDELTECPDCGSSKINMVDSMYMSARYFCRNCLREYDDYGKYVPPIK